MIARRHRSVGLAAALVLGATVASGAPSAAGPGPDGFSAQATAESARASFAVPGFATVERVVDVAGGLAQSALDTLGAQGFASLPYPGDLVLTGPGLFSAGTGQELPVGGYPLAVSATHPTAPESATSDPTGTYRVAAHAAADEATATARAARPTADGSPDGWGGSVTTASTTRQGDTVTAVATTLNEGLSLGDGALRIASVRSRVVTTWRAGDPEPKSASELVVEGGSAGSTSFSYGPNGWDVAGQGVPLPTAPGLEAVNAALAQSGLALGLEAPHGVAGGSSAGALEIQLTGRAPIPGAPPGVLRLVFGRAAAAINVAAAPVLSVPLPDAGSVDSPSPVEPAPAIDTLAPVAGSPGPFDSGSPVLPTAAGPAADGPVPPAALGAGDEAAAAPTLPAVGRTAASRPVAGLRPVPRRLEGGSFVFTTLLAGAVLMLVLSWLWRAKGVLPR